MPNRGRSDDSIEIATGRGTAVLTPRPQPISNSSPPLFNEARTEGYGYIVPKKLRDGKYPRIDRESFKTLSITIEPIKKVSKKQKVKSYNLIKKFKSVLAELSKKDPMREPLIEKIQKERKSFKEKLCIRLTLNSHKVATLIKISETGDPLHFPNKAEAYIWAINQLENNIRRKRKDNRKLTKAWKNFKGYDYVMVDGTHIDKGSILEINKNYKANMLESPKSPDAFHNHIGLEIEFFTDVPWPLVKQEFLKDGLYKHVYMKTDSSIECYDDNYEGEGYNGIELAILMKDHEYQDVVKKVCSALSNVDAQINDTCGIHVHFDMRNRNYKQAYFNLAQMQKYLFKMVDITRTNNEYCSRITNAQWDDSDQGHYYGINGKAAYNKFRTIEIRMHQGSLDTKEIINWIKLLKRIVDHRSEVYITDNISNNIFVNDLKFSEVNEAYKFDKDVYDYYKTNIGDENAS
ncbi:MAG: hypothetical protein COB41_00105 [Proteobacteria bacterium]|nr:MAG: hypothetical protein COB41_00105 [Pseudomonadota bacterium]